MSASSVPPERLQTGRPLPSHGSPGAGSPLSTVLSADSDDSSAFPPHFVAFAWRYLAFGSVCSHWLSRPQWAWTTSTAAPAPPARQGAHEPSRVPGRPLRTCPALRPRRLPAPGPYGAGVVAFRLVNDVSSAIAAFGALSHGLHAPCVRFAAGVAPGPRNTRFRWVANPFRDRTLTCRVTQGGFRLLVSFPALFPLPQALPGAITIQVSIARQLIMRDTLGHA
jgi:hypothetical protein